jgi:polysaccharide biosynthesis protein PslH
VLNLLYLATRSPWPPNDGGRVLMSGTIEGLVSRGHRITVVAPHDEAPMTAGFSSAVRVRLVPAPRRGRLSAVARALITGDPMSIARHRQPAVAAAVARWLDAERFDLVHVEQVHALPQAAPAFDRGVPVVWRAQNVESHLWRDLAGHGRGSMRLARFEAARLARWEGDGVARADATIALTREDARDLQALAPRAGGVHVIRAPMLHRLPASNITLPGTPGIIVFGSDWLPNQDGVRWFLDHVWPTVAAALPAARLHVFGFSQLKAATGVQFHPAPIDSRLAFAEGAVLAVPLRIGSGVRVRILEAWARGLPVVATSRAAAGLESSSVPSVLRADTPQEFVQAFRGLAGSPELVSGMRCAGRALLAQWHAPDQIAADLERVYLGTLAARVGRPA